MTAPPYRVLAPLGEGQNSDRVLLGRHTHLDRLDALKIFRVSQADGSRLLDEGRKMAALPEHQNVVRVTDAGEWDDHQVYIASEYCERGTLDALLRTDTHDVAEVCNLIAQACRGLEHLHRNGLLHLDIRPANVFLDSSGRPKIGDFGLARWSDAPGRGVAYAAHAAPEQHRGLVPTEASDQYAMAMTLAHLLSDGNVCAELPPVPYQASLDGEWPRLDLLSRTVPKRLRRVIKKATAHGVADRYRDIGAFRAALDKVTPGVGLVDVSQTRMQSSDGVWCIDWWFDRGHRIEVRKNGRRRTAQCKEGLSERQALRHLEAIVEELSRL